VRKAVLLTETRDPQRGEVFLDEAPRRRALAAGGFAFASKTLEDLPQCFFESRRAKRAPFLKDRWTTVAKCFCARGAA